MSGKNGRSKQEAIKTAINQSNRVFRTKKGVTLTLQPVDSAIIYATQNPASMPQPPRKEVKVAGGDVLIIEDDKDEEYQRDLAMWILKMNFNAKFLLYTQGVADTPPESFFKYMAHIGETDEYMVKFHWVCSLVPEGEESDALVERIGGLSMPTEGGIAQAEDTFPSEVQNGAGQLEEPEPTAT